MGAHDLETPHLNGNCNKNLVKPYLLLERKCRVNLAKSSLFLCSLPFLNRKFWGRSFFALTFFRKKMRRKSFTSEISSHQSQKRHEPRAM